MLVSDRAMERVCFVRGEEGIGKLWISEAEGPMALRLQKVGADRVSTFERSTHWVSRRWLL